MDLRPANDSRQLAQRARFRAELLRSRHGERHRRESRDGGSAISLPVLTLCLPIPRRSLPSWKQPSETENQPRSDPMNSPSLPVGSSHSAKRGLRHALRRLGLTCATVSRPRGTPGRRCRCTRRCRRPGAVFADQRDADRGRFSPPHARQGWCGRSAAYRLGPVAAEAQRLADGAAVADRAPAQRVAVGPPRGRAASIAAETIAWPTNQVPPSASKRMKPLCRAGPIADRRRVQ